MTEIQKLLAEALAKTLELRAQVPEVEEIKGLKKAISAAEHEAASAGSYLDEFCEEQKTYSRKFTLHLSPEEMTVGTFWVSGVLHEKSASLGNRNVASEVRFSMEAITAWAHEKARELNGTVVRITDAGIGLDFDDATRDAIATAVLDRVA